jgi:hypothetical protein
LLNEAFENIVPRMINHIEWVGWQEAVVTLALDWPEDFGSDMGLKADEVIRYFGERARGFVSGSDLKPERVVGVFNVLARLLTERERDSSVRFCCDIDTMRGFVDAVRYSAIEVMKSIAEKGEPGPFISAIHSGVGVLSLIIKVVRKAAIKKELDPRHRSRADSDEDQESQDDPDRWLTKARDVLACWEQASIAGNRRVCDGIRNKNHSKFVAECLS